MKASDHHNLSVAILAGGFSSRMGQDKGLMDFEGIPMVAHVINAASGLNLEALLVTSHKGYEVFGLPRVEDIQAHLGPMSGLEAALANCKTDRLLLLPCDMTLLSVSFLDGFLNALAEDEGGMLQWQAKLFPLPGIYLKSWLPAVSKALMEGRRSITAFANEMGAKLVDAETLNGFHDDILRNFNSPDDLQSYFEQKQRASKR